MQGLQLDLAPATWKKCERSPISVCPVLLDSLGFQHAEIHLTVGQWSVHCNGLFQELPALTHITCPSSLSPFPVHVPFPHHCSGMPTLHSSKTPSSAHSHLPMFTPHPCPCGSIRGARRNMWEVPTATSAPNSPSSPVPSPVPPPFIFLKCFEGVEISRLSQLSLARASGQFQLASNVRASALCSIVPACLFPQTSIVHYSR